MALTAGTRLGPYEILNALGAGGMGEVYKARDTRLDRAVAVKVIHETAAADPDLRERFEREARAISALDHPHICMLYDVCRETPSGGGATPISFLVMQHLEGETLADRLARAGKPASDPSRPSSGGDSTTMASIARGPIPFDTAIKFAAEIAQALDAAHRRGIVHRDLKPGNVMLTKSGTKLLDFGLAKLTGQDDAVGVAAFGDGATRTRPLTSQGAILGTLQYMSPEQLEGRDVDSRADIFAFGAVLFEMLSGRRAFDAPSQAGIIAAIIGSESPALTEFADARASLPVVSRRALDRLLAKCLAKNPDDRWQSAADLAAELHWIAEERLRAVPDAPIAAAVTPVDATRARTRERVWMAVTAVALIALASVAYVWYPRPMSPPPAVTFTVSPPAGDKLSAGPGLLALSPDGGRLVFMTGSASSGKMWIRAVGSLDLEPIERGTGGWQPAWSADGRSITFSSPNGQEPFRKIDLAGGKVVTQLLPSGGGRAAWNAADVLLVHGNSDDPRLFRMPASGGAPAAEMNLDASRQESQILWPLFLPDGRRYLFIGQSNDPSKNALFLAVLGKPDRTFLLNALSNVDYAGGYLFYQRDGTLMAHPFDAAAGRIAGEPFPVIENIRYNASNGRAAFSVSPSGALAYVPGDDIITAGERTLALIDRTGKTSRPTGASGPYLAAMLSPDGRQALITQAIGQNAKQSLWLLEMERGVLSKFTVGSDSERNGVWAPDGKSIVFESVRDGEIGLYRRSAGGGATSDEKLFTAHRTLVPTGFSPDGQQLLFSQGGGASARIWRLPLAGDRKPIEVFPGAKMLNAGAVFSPDGKWMAYSAGSDTDRSQVYIQPYPADDRRLTISPVSGRFPTWSKDGRHIVYRTADGAVESVELTALNGTYRVSAPTVLFKRTPTALASGVFSTDAMQQQFLIVETSEKGNAVAAATPITVIVNFVQNLKPPRAGSGQ